MSRETQLAEIKAQKIKKHGSKPEPLSTPKLDKLLKKEEQLKALIQKEKARLTKNTRQERSGKLIAWGIALEKLFQDGNSEITPERWAALCKETLDGRQLENAFQGELEKFK